MPRPRCKHLRLPREDGQEAACSLRGGQAVDIAFCPGCPQNSLRRAHRGNVGGKPQPVVNRFGGDAGLENLYLGGHLFLILSGPSLNDLDLPLLHRRGCTTMAVNNAAAWFRPTLWTHGDGANKFHDSIWLDPGLLKFTPFPRLGSPARTRAEHGRLVNAGFAPQDCPGVFGLRRNSDFNPERWLWEETVNWGNGKKEAEKNGYPRVLSTMIQAIRLAFYLGFRSVYLLGCDFTMSEQYAYAFPEKRSEGAVAGNNSNYLAISRLLAMLRPGFDSVGFEVLNCNPDSNLRVFDHLPYEAAVARATDAIDQEPDTRGWYED